MKFSTLVRVTAVLALLLVAACASEDSDFNLSEADIAASIQLTPETAEITGDGFSTIELRAEISPESTKRTIEFTTDFGSLVGGTLSGDKKTSTVTIDGSGTAAILLRSDANIGQALVTASVMDAPEITRSAVISFTLANTNDIYEFAALPTLTIPADGTTRTPLTFNIKSDLSGVNPKILRVSSSLGTILPAPSDNNGYTIQAPGTFTVDLQSPSETGVVRISAELAGFTQQTALTAERARPSSIFVSASSAQISAAMPQNVMITATLLREIGDVSNGELVDFTATDQTGEPSGAFTQTLTSSTNGQVTTTYSPRRNLANGNEITISATVQSNNALSSSISLLIVQ